MKKEKETPKKAAPAAEEPAKGQLKREFKNGMEIVNIAMGKPGGKQAKPGKKILMKYVGKLQSGKIFDQTRGNSTFTFRLGIGEVIKGWDVGVDGMRVGDKRRLTIPPAMAYGKKGVKRHPEAPPSSSTSRSSTCWSGTPRLGPPAEHVHINSTARCYRTVNAKRGAHPRRGAS